MEPARRRKGAEKMIPISELHIFHIYLLFWLIALVILWIRQEMRQKKAYDWSVVKERLYFCDNCHLSFLSQHDSENVTRCPRCNELCFIRKRKRF